MQLVHLAPFVGLLGFLSPLAALSVHVGDDEEPWCVLHRFNVRTSKGHAVQFVTNEDGSIEATLCADMENFFVSAEPVEPTFSSGKKCKLAGLPRNPVDVEMGKEVHEEIYTYETDPEKPAEKTPLTVRRLNLGADQSECELTRVRSAAEDCGYAPYLEEQRQIAAMNPGAAMKTPEAPVSEVTVFEQGEERAGLEKPPKHAKAKRVFSPARFRRHHKEPTKQRRSAKWSHLRKNPGIRGLDGC